MRMRMRMRSSGKTHPHPHPDLAPQHQGGVSPFRFLWDNDFLRSERGGKGKFTFTGLLLGRGEGARRADEGRRIGLALRINPTVYERPQAARSAPSRQPSPRRGEGEKALVPRMPWPSPNGETPRQGQGPELVRSALTPPRGYRPSGAGFRPRPFRTAPSPRHR
jgi:hypothetical protein